MEGEAEEDQGGHTGSVEQRGGDLPGRKKRVRLLLRTGQDLATRVNEVPGSENAKPMKPPRSAITR